MNYVGTPPSANTLNLLGDYAPVGAINYFHAPPDASWLRLQGQTVAKASYPDLWNYAQQFLTLDQVVNPGLYRDIDANNFALPNFSGMFIRAAGQVDANHVAAAVGVKQADANLSHRHGILAYNNPGANTGQLAGGGANTGTNATDIQLDGGPEARPINVALTACVKALKAVVLAPAVSTTPAGLLVQSVAHIRTDWYAPATIAIPGDDTIPQITEGQEYLSVANFAPMFVGSRVRLTLQFYWTASGIIQMISALFRSGTANCLASMAQVNAAGDFETIHTYEFEFIAASTTPFTYSFRAGGNTGGAAPVRMNGRGARMLGGTTQSFLRIDEYAPSTTVIAPPAGASIAGQGDQEAATALDKLVTSGTQKWSPSAAKVLCNFDASGVVAFAVNVTSVTDNGVGDWTVNFATSFSSTKMVSSFKSMGTFSIGAGQTLFYCAATAVPLVNQIRCQGCYYTGSTNNCVALDSGDNHLVVFGDL